MSRLRLGILGSGKGSNCRAILEAIHRGVISAEAALVVADVQEAGILQIAREFDVPAVYLPPGAYRTRLTNESEAALVRFLRDAEVDLVVLAGFMRILKTPMLEAFPCRIINIHPSLLPKFPGLEAWRQALEAGERETGCTVHYVDAGVDTGDILGQRVVPVLPNDTARTLHARIQIAERELYPEMIGRLAATQAR